MTKEEQSIEFVNPEINKLKVGAGIGIILFSTIGIIIRLSASSLTGVGGVLIGLGIGGQKYKGQWIKKREGQEYRSQWITRRDEG
jgi:hypothetical protein